MRILGFSERWAKLEQDTFTTFRLPRRDKDWRVGEYVQVVLHPRGKNREKLGVALIIRKEPRDLAIGWGESRVGMLTNAEAIEDGFENLGRMLAWLLKTHDFKRLASEWMNRLTLQWLYRENGS